METPAGATAATFATLPPERTLVLWLDPPERDRVEAALAAMATTWAPYVRLVRASLADPQRLVARDGDGRLNVYHLDTMLARATWAAIKADPRLARGYLQDLASKPRIYG
jgi:hypothetical protein